MSEHEGLTHHLEGNIVYGLHSGVALLMDDHRPPHGNRSGWHAPPGYNAEALKATPRGLPYITALRQRGYTVSVIKRQAAPRCRAPCALQDAQRATRFVQRLAQRFGIAAARIGACCGSPGGHLACLLGTLQGIGDPQGPGPVNCSSARVPCVVARTAPVDLVHILDGSSGGIVAGCMGIFPRGEADGAYLSEHQTCRQAAPISQVEASAPPLLFIHGNVDDSVPCQQSRMMRAPLEAVSVPVEVLCPPGHGHDPNFPGAMDPPDRPGTLVRWSDTHRRSLPPC